MKMNRIAAFLVLLAAWGCQRSPKSPGSVSMEIGAKWEFKSTEETSWLPAQVPGEVHRDLFRNQLIPDPFVANHEGELQWIGEDSWEYKTSFRLDDATLAMPHIELEFRNLDTYASVFLNENLVLEANNAFRTYRINPLNSLKAENNLRIVFASPSVHEARAKAQLPYELPGGDRVFTRKPQFHYGWDWGPKFITCGIGQPVVLHAWGDFKLDDVHVKQIALEDARADLEAVFEFRSQLKDSIEVEVLVNGELVDVKNVSSQGNFLEVPFSIENPRRWWPHNVGEPYRYQLDFVLKQDERLLDNVQVMKGLRTMELVNEKDSLGESFFFKVNGEPIYAKGANYIPQSSFQSDVEVQDFEKLLQDAVDANMNMLRVWGGGRYEEDVFYDLCDEKGILVWQDFMFACAMYPGDAAFLENVEREAIDNIKRLRNHCSIALWCGNNENSEGWARWGWQTDRSEVEKAEIQAAYDAVFVSLLPATLQQHNPGAAYWESSPQYGRGNPLYETVGDAHDWWVWHDGYPFEHFEEAVPRFMSEFGFQSFPNYASIRYINGNDSLDIASEAFASHQKHPRGFALVKEYMARDYPVPLVAEDYVYVSQLLQARGMAMGIEAQRRARPYNMGSLYWQLNDCWPVVSWSGIDHTGQWKALHYQAKRSLEDVLVSMEREGDRLKFVLVNDLLEDQQGEFQIRVLDFAGNERLTESRAATAPANSSWVACELNLQALARDSSKIVVEASFGEQRRFFYLARPKNLVLPNGEVEYSIVKAAGKGFSITLESPVLQKDLFLYSRQTGAFSDNFFDLLPGEKKTLVFETKAESLEEIQFKSLNGLLGK